MEILPGMPFWLCSSVTTNSSGDCSLLKLVGVLRPGACTPHPATEKLDPLTTLKAELVGECAMITGEMVVMVYVVVKTSGIVKLVTPVPW